MRDAWLERPTGGSHDCEPARCRIGGCLTTNDYGAACAVAGPPVFAQTTHRLVKLLIADPIGTKIAFPLNSILIPIARHHSTPHFIMKILDSLRFATIFWITAMTVTTATVEAQQPESQVPEGSPSKISDWALAGIIWSDASLTKKLATQAAQESDSADQAAMYERLAQKSKKLVIAMESFGWKQVTRSTSVDDGGSPPSADQGKSLPDPEEVGAELAESLDLPVDESSDPPRRNRRMQRRGDNAPPTLDPAVKRFDTETPAGRDDPGLDDERIGEGISLDVSNYRVDDYIDETPRESRNRADAIEDGVEGAIAAASGRLGMGRGTAGRISRREVQTRSATLPYAQDSIYDADDYDPDVDYQVDNPLGTQSTNFESADLGDRDDDINLQNPAKVVDGEDELIAAMKRKQSDTNGRGSSTQTGTARSPRTNLDHYTQERSKHDRDANWVQFHLDANQSVWNDFTTRENINTQTKTAVMKLRADMKAAIAATESERLQSILRQF